MNDTREPICTVVGNVDCGKTSLLDLLRNSNVQINESGNITQRIGVTNYSYESMVKTIGETTKSIDIPGIMFIDTPGHQCFANQRSCGVGVSDLAILLVDVFKGVEKQTLECIQLLKDTKTPFMIVVNKIDRIYEWKSDNLKTFKSLKTVFKEQRKDIIKTLDDHINKIIVQFAVNGLNAIAYYNNKNPKEFISIVPMSAKTGDGIPDMLLVLNTLSNRFLRKKLIINRDQNRGFMIEKIKNDKFGNVITTILTDGKIKVGDDVTFVDSHNKICNTRVKHIYIPKNDKEVKDKFVLNRIESVDASKSVIIKTADDINIKNGSRFYLYENDEERDKCNKLLEDELEEEEEFEFETPGIFINTPTLSMAHALYSFLKSEGHVVEGINVGPVKKSHIIKAGAHQDRLKVNKTNLNSVDEEIYNSRYGIILSFDADVSKEMKTYASTVNVTILEDSIIYKLVEKFKKHIDNIAKRIKERHPSIQPKCKLEILKQHIFTKKNPIIIGVKVIDKILVKGMILKTKNIVLGEVVSIQKDNKALDEAKANNEVCIKIESKDDKHYEYDKDFDYNDILETYYSKNDIDMIKIYGDIFNIE